MTERSALAPEHESCASDLSELNWHVDFNTKKYDIILQLVNKAEAQNRKLKEDIEFINGHVLVDVYPLTPPSSNKTVGFLLSNIHLVDLLSRKN